MMWLARFWILYRIDACVQAVTDGDGVNIKSRSRDLDLAGLAWAPSVCRLAAHKLSGMMILSHMQVIRCAEIMTT